MEVTKKTKRKRDKKKARKKSIEKKSEKREENSRQHFKLRNLDRSIIFMNLTTKCSYNCFSFQIKLMKLFQSNAYQTKGNGPELGAGEGGG